MARVDFYILPEGNSPERFACSIAGKGRQQDYDIYIHTDSKENAGKMDDLLWTHKDISFLPHGLIDAAETDTGNITIGWAGHAPCAAKVLINLGGSIPDFANDYERIVEIVSAEPAHRRQAREHYRQYREFGFELHDHQIGA